MHAALVMHWQLTANTVNATVDTVVIQASALGQARTVSSHCSGFGSAEIALTFLKVGLAFAGWHGLAIRSISACAGCPVIQTACASVDPALIPRMWTPGAWHFCGSSNSRTAIPNTSLATCLACWPAPPCWKGLLGAMAIQRCVGRPQLTSMSQERLAKILLQMGIDKECLALSGQPSLPGLLWSWL